MENYKAASYLSVWRRRQVHIMNACLGMAQSDASSSAAWLCSWQQTLCSGVGSNNSVNGSLNQFNVLCKFFTAFI